MPKGESHKSLLNMGLRASGAEQLEDCVKRTQKPRKTRAKKPHNAPPDPREGALASDLPARNPAAS
jgi:hypothetical protein